MAKEKEVLGPKDRTDWRRWLEANHASSTGIWLELSKKGARTTRITYEEALEEALAHGWIDGRTKKVDEERFKIMFTPRRQGSGWAESNKRRVQALMEKGRMAPAGMAKVKEAKLDGSWNALDEVERGTVPADLMEALENSSGAKEGFFRLSASHRKQYLYWISDAKRPETRSRRIQGTVSMVLKEEQGGGPNKE